MADDQTDSEVSAWVDILDKGPLAKPMSAEVPPNSIHPKPRADWRAWLSEHHQRDQGVWLITYQKATGKPRIDNNDAVEEALCFGWIDSKPSKLDAERWMLWFAPRQPGSG